VISYLPGTPNIQAVDTLLHNHQLTLAALKDNLDMAQNQIRQRHDQHRSKRSFEAGDKVFLHLQLYKITSLKHLGHKKEAMKFYGPYQVV
jgi:hypothetical protein